jgi:hypothetical protein
MRAAHADPTAALLGCAPQAPSPPHPCLGAKDVFGDLSDGLPTVATGFRQNKKEKMALRLY